MTENILCIILIGVFCSKALAAEPVTNEPPLITLQAAQQFPFALRIDTGGATNILLHRSEDLKDWRAHFNIFSKLRFFYFIDRSTIGTKHSAQFYRASNVTQSTDEMLRNWRGFSLTKYKYKFQRTCMCEPTILSGIVSVSDGKVIAVTDARNAGGAPISNPDLSQFKSIEQLFDIVASETPKAEILAVAFDRVLHFPVRIEINYDALAVDDEETYQASDVQTIQ